jgi:uncharacterized protein YoxC
MSLNPPDLPYGLKRVGVGAAPGDGQGIPWRTAWIRYNDTMEIISSLFNVIIGDLEGAIGGIEGLAEQLAQIQASIQAIQTTLTSHGNSISTLQGQVSTIQGQISTLQSQVSTLQGQVANHLGRIQTLESQMSGALSSISNMQSAITSLQNQMAALTTLVNSKADINSPQFTGAPVLAGSAVPGTGETGNRLVSAGWVIGRINALISAIPQQSGDGFASGTRLLFFNGSAPNGWTKEAVNDSGIRVVSGSGGLETSGTDPFSTVFTNKGTTSVQVNVQSGGGGNTGNTTVNVQSGGGGNTGSTSLSVSQLPSHNHQIGLARGGSDGGTTYASTDNNAQFRGTMNSQSTGSNASHSHSLPSHSHTSSAHNHSVSSHSHTTSSHSHSIGLNLRYVDGILCRKL